MELLDLLGKVETEQILKMSPKDLKFTARVNLTKFKRSEIIKRLKEENIKARPSEKLPEGIEITSGRKWLGSSLSYLNGELIPQGMGSMLTVHALDPQPGDFIIDMSAAPGGKSTFIAERMKFEGRLVVNDISPKRFRSLLFNVARLGLTNLEYSVQDGRKLQFNNVDKILLDAPCTGGGLLISEPQRRTSKDISDSIQLQKLQIQLLRNALELLDTGGVCLYSTCAISPIENELVVQKFTNLVKFEQLKIPGTDVVIEDEKIGIRLYPHKDFCDGFFIVKMVKL